jgi:hypothetical protein
MYNEIETEIKNLTTKNSPRLDDIIAEFYPTFKEDITPMFLKLCHMVKREA